MRKRSLHMMVTLSNFEAHEVYIYVLFFDQWEPLLSQKMLDRQWRNRTRKTSRCPARLKRLLSFLTPSVGASTCGHADSMASRASDVLVVGVGKILQDQSLDVRSSYGGGRRHY